MTAPVVIAVAPNGARRTKADHPALPLTARELGREAAACSEAGATLLHLHVRDARGAHTIDPDAYREAITAVRREAGPALVIQMTTEAVGRFTPDEQMASVREVRPEAVSLAVRELVPTSASEPAAAAFLSECVARGTSMQYILYDVADLTRYEDLVRRGAIPDRRATVLFVLGRYTAGQVSRPEDLARFLSAYGLGDPWFVCAFGAQEHACAMAAVTRGGHVRVGFENNLLLADGRIAPGNAALVSGVADSARAAGRAVATHADALAVLGGG